MRLFNRLNFSFALLESTQSEEVETKSLSIPDELAKIGVIEVHAQFSDEESEFSGEIHGSLETGQTFDFILQKDGVYHFQLNNPDGFIDYQEDADLKTSSNIITLLHDRIVHAMTSNESTEAYKVPLINLPDGIYDATIQGYEINISSENVKFKTFECGLRNAFPIKCKAIIRNGLGMVKSIEGEPGFVDMYSSADAKSYWMSNFGRNYYNFLSTLNESFNDYPEKAVENAKRALKWREEHSDEIVGGTRIGWTRANQIAKRENLSLDTVKRIWKFKRHEKNSVIDPSKKGKPWTDAGYVAWLIWGGDEMINWAGKTIKREIKNK